jgi:uncharacterized protein (DUF2236 family)
VQTWIYGGAEALEESRRLRRLHKSLGATDARGRTFHALEPGPWAWVPLTAYQSTLEYCRRFADPLPPADEKRLYDEVLRLCRILQVPERMLPPDVDAYWAYFERMIDETLEDHPTAHNLLDVIDEGPCPPWLPAPLRRLWRPFGSLPASNVMRLCTVGSLPQAAREKLGLRWRRRDELQLRAIGRALGETNARLPERAKYMEIAYRARRGEPARLRAAPAARPL